VINCAGRQSYASQRHVVNWLAGTLPIGWLACCQLAGWHVVNWLACMLLIGWHVVNWLAGMLLIG